MKKSVLVLLVLAGLMLAAVTVHELVVPKTGWIDGFKSGSSNLNDQQRAEINELVEMLKYNPDKMIVLKGSVSREVIKSGRCHTTQDGLNFFLGSGYDSEDNIVGEQECELALGYSRAQQVKWELTDAPFHNNGISSTRVTVFKEVDFYRRPGDNSKNRAVSYWLVKLPEKAVLTEDLHEKTETGELVATYMFPKNSCWAKFWEATNLPPLSEWKIKSRWQERHQDPID